LELPETVEINPVNPPTGAVIWLHGLGADGHDFEPVVPELKLDGHLDLRFVFPHAPVREVTINNGIAMRAWYDLLTLDRNGPEDEAGMRESAALLGGLIEREKARGIAFDRIVVAGFSQGGAIALHTALRFPHRLCGLLALSTLLPLQYTLDEEVFGNEAVQGHDMPILIAHGAFDPMLPLALGRQACDVLEGAGFPVEWHEYPMAHAICPQEIADIRAWLLRVFGAWGPSHNRSTQF